MKILFLSHYFPPEVNAPATRTYEHCKEWVKAGHEVTVVSCVPHHPIGRIFPGYKNKLYQVEYKDGIRVIRLLTYVTRNSGFAKRTANYLFYMLMAIVAAPFLGRSDIVVSTSPQFFNGLAGYFVSRLKRAKWVLEIRDLWPESILAVGAIENKFVINLLQRMEKFTYRKAGHIISVTESFVSHLVENGAKKCNLSVVTNGCNLEQFQQIERDNAFAKEIGVDDKFVAAYVGTLGMAHGLETIVEAAEILNDRKEIVFLIVGHGAERESLLEAIEAKRLTNIIMLGLQPKEVMPKIWSVCDLSLVLLRDLPLFEKVIPSKIFESMAMGKPIVLGVRGESAAIIEKSGAGEVIEPQNAEMLAEAIQRFYDCNGVYDRALIGGTQAVGKYYDRKILAKRYLDMIMRIETNDKSH